MILSIDISDKHLIKFATSLALSGAIEKYLESSEPCLICNGNGWLKDGETHCPICHGQAWENPLKIKE
jgi:DnaJ-class molecular chaperone